MSLIQSDINRVVVGLGSTGLSTMRYFSRRGLPYRVVDTRECVDGLVEIKDEFPEADIVLGAAAAPIIDEADELYVSPGLSLDLPLFKSARNHGCQIAGDLDLFAEAVDQPVIAITGTNGKSTVTTLVGEFAKEAGMRVAVAGNIGVPMLDVIDEANDCYVLELSSFQLERSDRFRPTVACLLNVSDDHIDHHGSLLRYQQAKQRIYRGAEVAVYNRDDPLTRPLSREGLREISFGEEARSPEEYGLRKIDGEEYIVKGNEVVLATQEIVLEGRHNVHNVMAALATGEAAGFPVEAMISVVRRFSGLAHRCAVVADHAGVIFINDSKATNVGAAVAAIKGLKEQLEGRLILIAGGISKDADFSSFAAAFRGIEAVLVLMGRDAKAIEQSFASAGLANVQIVYAASMHEAVGTALQQSSAGDIVLLSPACASFDMFDDYRARGNAFVSALRDMQIPVEMEVEL